MRLMLLVTCLEGGGAQRVVFDLATGFRARGWEVRVVALRDPRGGCNRFGPRLAEAGVPVGEVRLRHAFDLPGILRLVREVRAYRPDVLHAHLFHAHLAARLLGRRVVCTHHEVERRRRPWRPLLQRLTAVLESASVAVSEAVAVHVRRSFGIRARVIPNGIDLSRFRPGERLEGGPRVVGAVGRLHPQKGLEDLVDALVLLDRPDVRLLLAGEGEEEERLRRRAAPLGDRVRFLGYVEDVPGFLAGLDVLAMPSRWEGFGLALAEALACGVPVVATSVDSLPEVAESAAVLVPPGRPDLLAAALGRLLDDPAERERLRREGPLRAAAFGVERMVAAYAEVYEAVALG